MVVSEIYGSPIGLGKLHPAERLQLRRPPTRGGGTILIGILGYALSVVLVVVEYALLGWYHQRTPRGPRQLPPSAPRRTR